MRAGAVFKACCSVGLRRLRGSEARRAGGEGWIPFGADGFIRGGALVRLVPQWYADAGPISIYYATRTLLPAKTRVFVDFVAEAFRRQRLAERFAGSIG